MKRALRVLCCVGPLALLAAGCLPFAYPKLSFVPRCEPGATEVHAFRVDVNAVNSFGTGESGEYTLSEIALRPDGSVPPQGRVTLERGYYFLVFQIGKLHTTRVRLYRPGYQLVELSAWDSTGNIGWQPTNWGGQVGALTELLDRPRLMPTFVPSSSRLREHPSAPTAPEQERAFAFAAAEYQRLAELAPSPEQAERLRELAQKLLAAKPPATPSPR